VKENYPRKIGKDNLEILRNLLENYLDEIKGK